MMVYGTQNYWISGLYSSYGILNTKKHNISEIGCVSILRWAEGDTCTIYIVLLGHFPSGDILDLTDQLVGGYLTLEKLAVVDLIGMGNILEH
jgi:hypothetical protein